MQSALGMTDQWQRYYQPPGSPLARLGLALLGLGTLALLFLFGLVILAIAAGLAILGALYLSVRRWLGLSRGSRQSDDTLDVEYRVIRRDRDD